MHRNARFPNRAARAHCSELELKFQAGRSKSIEDIPVFDSEFCASVWQPLPNRG